MPRTEPHGEPGGSTARLCGANWREVLFGATLRRRPLTDYGCLRPGNRCVKRHFKEDSSCNLRRHSS
jgi:hypothetical protein